MEITIDINKLAAMKLFAAKKDVRYYLNGMLLEIGSRESRLVATDGHVMAIIRLDFCRPGPTQQVIIPIEALKGIKRGRGDATITLSDSGSNVVDLRIESPTWQWACQSVDAAYPDWRKVLPEKVSGEVAQFNADYLAAFQDAAVMLSGGLITVGHNGTGGALISINNDDFVGIIMPIRQKFEALTGSPAWASESLEALQVAA